MAKLLRGLIGRANLAKPAAGDKRHPRDDFTAENMGSFAHFAVAAVVDSPG